MCWPVPGGGPAGHDMSFPTVTLWLYGRTLLSHGSMQITTSSEAFYVLWNFFFKAIIE